MIAFVGKTADDCILSSDFFNLTGISGSTSKAITEAITDTPSLINSYETLQKARVIGHIDMAPDDLKDLFSKDSRELEKIRRIHHSIGRL